MSLETLSKESALAVQYFEGKLNFEIGPIGLKRAIDGAEPVQVIDLRTPELYAKGHVPGAINLTYEELGKRASELDKAKTVVVYCYDITCHLSTMAALELAKKGYRVKELTGGWHDWVSHSQPVEGQVSSCSTAKTSCG